MSAHTSGLSRERVFEIAEKYGEFQYGDSQGHKRIEFAADVIAARQRLRDAAPDMLAALQMVASMPGFEADEKYGACVLAAIAKAVQP